MNYEKIAKTFYDELANGKLLGRRCKKCGAVEFPPRIACNSCGHLETEWTEVSGDAEVTNCWPLSMMADLEQNRCFEPYVIGNVKLKEGPEINAIICGKDQQAFPGIWEKLPLPAKARIVDRGGYHMVVFDFSEE